MSVLEENKAPQKEGYETLVSHNRPLPLGAKKDLRKAVDDVEYHDSNNRVVYVSELPDDSLLDEWELTRVRYDDPEEVWESDHTTVKIFSDRVIADGRETDLTPKEAKEQARNQDYFNRVDE